VPEDESGYGLIDANLSLSTTRGLWSTMNSTALSPAEIAVYCAEAQNESMACLGWCPNPGIGGIGARSAAFAQAIISGYSIVWLDLADARNVYYVQALSSVSLVVIGYLYGGFLSEKTVTAYHALLIVYLTMGNVVSAAVAFYMGIFFESVLGLTVFIVSVVGFAVALTVMMVASTGRGVRGFGSQPECNNQIIQSPFHIPLGVILFILAIVPWILSIVSSRVGGWFSKAKGSNRRDWSRVLARDYARRILWSLFLAVYYAAWVYLTEAYIRIQKVPMLTRAEFRFTQDQVQALALAGVTSFFPIRAILSGVVGTTTTVRQASREGSFAADHVPLVSPNEPYDPPPYSDETRTTRASA